MTTVVTGYHEIRNFLAMKGAGFRWPGARVTATKASPPRDKSGGQWGRLTAKIQEVAKKLGRPFVAGEVHDLIPAEWGYSLNSVRKNCSRMTSRGQLRKHGERRAASGKLETIWKAVED